MRLMTPIVAGLIFFALSILGLFMAAKAADGLFQLAGFLIFAFAVFVGFRYALMLEKKREDRLHEHGGESA